MSAKASSAQSAPPAIDIADRPRAQSMLALADVMLRYKELPTEDTKAQGP
jgi:hypothetical protein